MSWDYERSEKRIREHMDNLGEITVEKLTRKVDLHTLLSETNCREIYGAHIYLQVVNLGLFRTLAAAAITFPTDSGIRPARRRCGEEKRALFAPFSPPTTPMQRECGRAIFCDQRQVSKGLAIPTVSKPRLAL